MFEADVRAGELYKGGVLIAPNGLVLAVMNLISRLAARRSKGEA